MIDAIKRFDVLGVGVVAGFAFFVAGPGIGLRLGDQSNRTCRRAGAHAERAQNIAPVDLGLVVLCHRQSSIIRLARACAAHAGSAKASASISMNTRPTVPTRL